MRFSVCIESIYEGLAPEEAISKTAATGLPAIEFWSWWNKDLSSLQQALEKHHITPAAFCTRSNNLTDPKQRGKYLEDLELSIEAAEKIGCRRLITQSGPELGGLSRAAQSESLYAGLEACKPLLDQSKITLLVEPLNTVRDHPGVFLSDSHETFELVRSLAHPQIRVLFDIYHQQISCGNILDSILPNLDLIGHFHAASVPGRHELELGELHYGRIFREISKAGYQGYMGLEYWPTADANITLRQCMSL